jgi:hypothetical protein
LLGNYTALLLFSRRLFRLQGIDKRWG